MRLRISGLRIMAAIVAASGLAAMHLAHAGLGQHLDAASADGRLVAGAPRLVARIASAAMQAGVQTQTVQTVQGDTVVEYADASGMVFAVTWRGPFSPNLAQILGTYFGAYIQATHVVRGLTDASSQSADIVVHSHGHMRNFDGVAWVPALVPAGFDASGLTP